MQNNTHQEYGVYAGEVVSFKINGQWQSAQQYEEIDYLKGVVRTQDVLISNAKKEFQEQEAEIEMLRLALTKITYQADPKSEIFCLPIINAIAVNDLKQ